MSYPENIDTLFVTCKISVLACGAQNRHVFSRLKTNAVPVASRMKVQEENRGGGAIKKVALYLLRSRKVPRYELASAA